MAAGGLVIAGPLEAFAARLAAGLKRPRAEGYGPLIDMGTLSLPRGFHYRVISRQGDRMVGGNPTPGIFDGQAAFRGRGGFAIIRNHENRRRAGETAVVVPNHLRYDPDPSFNAGCTKLVLDESGRRTLESFALIGGTSTNCAGGVTPWGSWITCEEIFDDGERPHGYIFEVPAAAPGPVKAVPIPGAGRFAHEAVAWHRGVLYETEDRNDSSFYRYRPSRLPRRAGDLAATRGSLEALAIRGHPRAFTSADWPVGTSFDVKWVEIEEPEPSSEDAAIGSGVRYEAQSKGAAVFNRQEGIAVDGGRVYFDCTEGGDAGIGQIWEYRPYSAKLTLVYESRRPEALKNPDHLVVAPTGHLLLCEDSDPPPFLRGMTPDGRMYDMARANTNESEFCGVTFCPDRRTLYLNQQGERDGVTSAVTYAIWGPWGRLRDGERPRLAPRNAL